MDYQTIQNDLPLAIAMGDADRIAELVEQRDAFPEADDTMEVVQ